MDRLKVHGRTRRFRMSRATHLSQTPPWCTRDFTLLFVFFSQFLAYITLVALSCDATGHCTVAHMCRSVSRQLHVHTKRYSTLRLSGSMQIPYAYYLVHFVQACRKPCRYMQQ